MHDDAGACGINHAELINLRQLHVFGEGGGGREGGSENGCSNFKNVTA